MEQDRIKDYYNSEIEKNRLELNPFKLEGIRTKEIISRYLNSGKLKIADVGGGAGYYAFWLQSLGHQVSLVDLTPRNVALVHELSKQRNIQLTSCEVGDATQLKFQDDQFDIVLLLGPLYHLTNREARVKALAEAKRILKPGGILIAAIISRYASLVDGFKRNLIADDEFIKILTGDLAEGVHINETDNLEYFTTAYFHTPAEIKSEICDSGLRLERLVAVESAATLLDNQADKMKDPSYREKILAIILSIESNEDILAMSPHILGISRKEGQD